jgi:hypothetical protein
MLICNIYRQHSVLYLPSLDIDRRKGPAGKYSRALRVLLNSFAVGVDPLAHPVREVTTLIWNVDIPSAPDPKAVSRVL